MGVVDLAEVEAAQDPQRVFVIAVRPGPFLRWVGWRTTNEGRLWMISQAVIVGSHSFSITEVSRSRVSVRLVCVN